MNRIVRVSLLVVIGGMISFATLFAQAQAEKGAHYSGVLIGTGGVAGGASMWIDMYVDEFTDNEEALGYLTILKEKGQDAVVRALEKSNIGRVVAPSGGNVYLAVARKIESETGTVVRLFTARPMHFLERYEMTRSSQYPISLIELMLDKDGNGQGAIIAAGKVKITEDGRLELESLGNQYVKITNVRRVE